MTIANEPINLRVPIAAEEAEHAALRELGALLTDEATGSLLLVGQQREVTVPPTLLLLLRRLVEQLAGKRAIRIETFGREVTLWEAADILGEPLQRVRQLIAEGVLLAQEADPSGAINLQRITLSDLLAYQAMRSARQTEAINELLQLSEELGLYDRDIQIDDAADAADAIVDNER